MVMLIDGTSVRDGRHVYHVAERHRGGIMGDVKRPRAIATLSP
jgi:hypothetical protein